MTVETPFLRFWRTCPTLPLGEAWALWSAR